MCLEIARVNRFTNNGSRSRFTFAESPGLCPLRRMKRFGVKLNNGKIMWVQAEAVECWDGALRFFHGTGEQRELLRACRRRPAQGFCNL